MIGVEKYVEIKTNGVDSIEGQPVPTRDPVVQTLNVTPLKTAQTFNAPSGVDGYNPVNVSAVTSSIDSNITAGNIKDGVTILGVQGNYTGSGATIESLSITPTTSEQTITASGIDGYSPITVSAVTSSIDSNITAENIKSGVTILGVTGTAEIAPTYYIEKTNINGTLTNTNKLIDFTGITDVSHRALAGQYCYSAFPANTTIDLSSLTSISGMSAFYETFYNCSGIKTVKLTHLVRIGHTNGCTRMFNGCTDLRTVDLSSLTTLSGQNACTQMFSGCTVLTNLDISSLTTLSGYGCCDSMFVNCSSLTSVNLNALTTMSAGAVCNRMFQNTGLTSVTFNSLNSMQATSVLSSAFSGCTNLTSLSFPALKGTSFGSYNNQFNNMLYGVTGCTVHFPSNLQLGMSSWSDVTNGFGGTSTTVLFDLPATE